MDRVHLLKNKKHYCLVSNYENADLFFTKINISLNNPRLFRL